MVCHGHVDRVKDKLKKHGYSGTPVPVIRTLITAESVNTHVDSYASEFESAAFHFCRLLNKKPCVVVNVELIEYRAGEISLVNNVQSRFQEKERQISHAHGLGTEATRKIWVFHGTSSLKAIDSICRDGFQVGGRNVPIRNGAAYGCGVYTSTSPQDPIDYAAGQGRVILAQGIRGQLGHNAQSQNDSWTPVNQPSWLIFRDGDQLLPRYIVHYDETRDSVPLPPPVLPPVPQRLLPPPVLPPVPQRSLKDILYLSFFLYLHYLLVPCLYKLYMYIFDTEN